jgi:hypothetical protein
LFSGGAIYPWPDPRAAVYNSRPYRPMELIFMPRMFLGQTQAKRGIYALSPERQQQEEISSSRRMEKKGIMRLG